MTDSLRKIHLIRHAESVWNKERRVQGTSLGVPLSTLGKVQARMLGDRLRTLPFEHVYSSDADRALETARIALGKDHPVTLLSELRELSLGKWEGRLISEIKSEFPEELQRWYIKPTTVHIEEAEDITSLRDRAVAAMERIVDSSGSGDVLVITHGGFICSYLTYLMKMDLDDIWCFSLPNVSLTTIVLDFRLRLRAFGDTSHIRGDALGFDGMPSAF